MNKETCLNSLINDNMGLVKSIVDSFNPANHTEKDDLIDAGRIGLWNALKKYDKNKGSIATYSWMPIRWEIIKEIKHKRYHVNIDDIVAPAVYREEYMWEYLTSDLDESEMRVFKLRAEGNKLTEVSRIMECSYSYIKKVYAGAVKKLRVANNEQQ